MSVNIYLTEAVKDLEGFSTKPYPDGSGDDARIDGMHLFHDKGRWYVMHSDSDPVPAVLKDVVDKISYREWIPRMAPREAGIYNHETAEGELVLDSRGGKEPKYQLSFTAKKMEDIWELVRLIKVGDIRPTQSYEGPQDGKSLKELIAEVTRLAEENKHLSERQAEYRKLCGKDLALRIFAEDLSEESFPFCSKARIIKAIGKISSR